MATPHGKIRGPKNKSVKSIVLPDDVMAFIKERAKAKEKKSPLTQEILDTVMVCYKNKLNLRESREAVKMISGGPSPIGERRIANMRKVINKRGKLTLGESDYL